MTAPVALRIRFLDEVIERSQEDDEQNLWSWFKPTGWMSDGSIEGRSQAVPSAILLIRADVVARGLWRIQGGQTTERPQGVTPAMHAAINKADADLDASLMSPATASALIQVGLFGQVTYS